MSDAHSAIIGGLMGFELGWLKGMPSAHRALPGWTRRTYVNARSAIWDVIRQLQPTRAWLPTFLCPVLLSTVPDVSRIEFYCPGSRLDFGTTEWISAVQPDDLVVIIDYFGWNNGRHVIARLKKRGACTIVDRSQCWPFPSTELAGDYVVYSPRKHVGVPDGGILLTAAKRERPQSSPCSSPVGWFATALNASLGRALFDRGDSSRAWYEAFQKAEAAMPLGAYAASDVTNAILELAPDDEVQGRAVKRRANYLLLAQRLSSLALFQDLPDDVIPLGFPIVVENRDQLQQAFFSEHIYPAVHWRLEGMVSTQHEVAHRLSQRILTLPCDDRCNLSDLARIAEIAASRGVPCSPTEA